MNSAMMVVLLLSAQPVPAPPAAPVPSGPPPVKSADGAAGIAAIWKESTITWDRLRPVLAELAGSAALQEVLLDEQLAQRARTRNIAPDAAALKREEE